MWCKILELHSIVHSTKNNLNILIKTESISVKVDKKFGLYTVQYIGQIY